MSRTLLFLVVVTLSAPALGQVADLNFGQVEVGGSWQVQTTEVKLSSFGPHDFHASTLATTVAVGLVPQRLSIFGSVGTGKVRLDGVGIDGNIDHYWQAGVRATVWREGPWSVGLTADVQQWKTQDSGFMADTILGVRVSLTEYRLRPTVARAIGPVTLYGGPQITSLDGSWSLFWGGSHDLFRPVHTTGEFGAFVGAQWQIHLHVSLGAEAEYTEFGPAARFGAVYRF